MCPTREKLELIRRLLSYDLREDQLRRLDEEAALRKATVNEAYAKFIEQLEISRGDSQHHLKTTKVRLKLFVAEFGQREIRALLRDELAQWLTSQNQ